MLAPRNNTEQHRCVVVVDGEQYDLTDFLHRHPGGPNLLLFVHGRDATIAVNTAHKDPARTVYPTLRRYKIEKTQMNEELLKDKLGIPNFLLPDQYNAITDGPDYNFDPKDETLLLNKVRKRILTKEVQQKIKHLDKMFDFVVMGLFALKVERCFFSTTGIFRMIGNFMSDLCISITWSRLHAEAGIAAVLMI